MKKYQSNYEGLSISERTMINYMAAILGLVEAITFFAITFFVRHKFSHEIEMVGAGDVSFVFSCIFSCLVGLGGFFYSRDEFRELRKNPNQERDLSTTPRTLQEFHSEYSPAFENTDFGSRDFPALILGSLENIAMGYWNGRTTQMILKELGLTETRGSDYEKHQALSKKGLQHLIALSNLAIIPIK